MNIVLESLYEIKKQYKEDFELAVINSLIKYVEKGNKLSNLSWFKGVNLAQIGA